MNTIATLQTELRDRLRADAYFVDISVYDEREDQLDSQIERSLRATTRKNSTCGAAVIVGAAELNCTRPNLPCRLDDNNLYITVIEVPQFNNGSSGSGKAALDIAVRAAHVCHLYHPVGLAQAIHCHRESVRPVEPENPGEVSYRLALSINPDIERDDKVATPAISPASGAAPREVTLTCATAGASIYYTLDDSHPYAGNDAAVLYTVPFTVAAAASLRVIAYKTDHIASDSALGNYT